MTIDTPILHVDMDAFYASVESIKDPSLAGKPVVVGGRGSRGVVTSASYEARALGVHSAMPIVTARRLCPQAVFRANDFSTYREYSRRIREVFLSFTPLVEPLSLDEAFLDVSGSIRLFGAPTDIAFAVKERIGALGLRCSVGVAPNKFLAKMASSLAKPDGSMVVPSRAVTGFLHPLPVSALWGVGPQTAEVLRRFGLRKIGDVARMSRASLEKVVGGALGAHLYELSRGIDDRPVIPDEPPRSVGSEETFEADLDDVSAILREILRLSDRTATRLRGKGLSARTVILKIRFSSFKTVTRSRTVAGGVDTAAEIYEVARSLYLKLDPDRPRIRLLGVSAGGLQPGAPRSQLDLFRGSGPGFQEAARAVDHIRRRFGDGAVGPAALLD